MHVTVKSNHLAKADAPAEVAKSPYAVNVPSAANLKKQTRNNKNANAPPLTNIERLKRREQRKGKSTGLKAEVAALRRTVRAWCNEIADMYDKKSHYVMDMFYQRSDLAAKNTYKVNPFNVYKSVVAHERREAGETPLHLLELQSAIAQDYKDLDDTALEKVVEKYRELRDKDKREKLKRPSMKEKIADVARSVDNMQGLKTHCGIEFVRLLVKSRPKPFMNPKWLATDGRIHDYLSLILRGWDPTYIGKKVEAFAVAGCDATKIFKSQKDQAEATKRHIVRIIQDGLDQTCGTENQVMQYERFDTTITMRYKVVVEGWPKGIPFQKPSAFGGVLEPLVRLQNAWQTGEAHFRKLGNDKFQTWLAQRAEKIEKGDIIPKARKKRSDAGVKRGGKDNGKEKASGGEDDGEESESGEKDTNGEESESGEKGRGDTEPKDAERPTKKAKTTASIKTKPAKPRRGAKKPRTTCRQPSRPSDDIDKDPDTSSGPSDALPPARTVPAPSAFPTEPLPKPHPQPRPVVPRKPAPAKPLEQTDSEQDGGEGSASAPVALTDVDSAIDTPRGAPETISDDHQAPSTEPRVPIDDALIDPSLRSVHIPPPIPETEPTATFERSSSPVRSSSPAPSVSVSSQGKRKRKSEEERLREDAKEHGMNDEKRSRVVARKRHLGAGSFNPKTRGEGINSDDEGFDNFQLC